MENRTLKITGSIFVVTLIILGTVTFNSCTKDKAQEVIIIPTYCEGDTISFSNDLLPIFQTNCVISGCHDPGTASGGYVWDNYTMISNNANTIFNAISHNPGVSPMPKFSPQLPDTTIQKIECWILQGTPNN